jgi:hypothetical protein
MKPARLSQARIFAAIDPDQPDEQYPAMRGRNHPDRIDLRIPAKPLLRRRLFSKAHFAFIFSYYFSSKILKDSGWIFRSGKAE